MGREIPGSFLEQGDGERRTWDEMVDRDQPFSADDDDYTDDEYVEDDDEDLTTLEDWLFGWSEPLTPAMERRLLADLDHEVHDLKERIYYRGIAADAGETLDVEASVADKERLAKLTEFRGLHPDPPADADEPGEPQPRPAAPARPTPPSPVRMVEAAIKEKLTATEMLHWEELQKGTKQTLIAEKLGIKQGAVSKRERRLRERIDAISIETIGRPYPEKLIDRGLWARQGRRRNKSAPRQR